MECTNIEPKTYRSRRVQTTPWCKAQLIGVSKGGQWSRHLWKKIERRSPKEWYLGRCVSLIHRYSRRSPKSLRACHRCTCRQPSPRLPSWCCHSSPLQQELLNKLRDDPTHYLHMSSYSKINQQIYLHYTLCMHHTCRLQDTRCIAIQEKISTQIKIKSLSGSQKKSHI
jgi:hypothetical protein